MKRTSTALPTPLFLCLCLIACGTVTQAQGQLKLPAIFSDNMVLQQDMDVPIWGWANPNDEITIKPSWQNNPLKITADNKGDWNLKLTPPKTYKGQYQIEFQGPTNRHTIKNILFGQVWLCSGQSNMAWTVSNSNNAQEEIAQADYPQIRMFQVAHATAGDPQKDCKGQWLICSPETVSAFSAAGYFFARPLHQSLNAPIGMIHTSWGGTRAEAWTNPTKLAQLGGYQADLDYARNAKNKEKFFQEFIQKLKNWEQSIGRSDPGNIGIKRGYNEQAYDDQDWKTITLPKHFEAEDEYKNFDGIVWFRKEIQLPETFQGQDLSITLSRIDDYDTTYFNGIQIGQTLHKGPTDWRLARRYHIPGNLVKSGRNLLAVRVIDTGQAGGIYGPANWMQISPVDSTRGTPVNLAGEWKYIVSHHFDATIPVTGRPGWPGEHNIAGSLYHAMIAPLVPYAIKGAIWYQGESNASKPYRYRTLFPAMIQNWRQEWNQGPFPFYFVQIAPFRYSSSVNTAELREAQTMAMSTPNTGMIVTSDIGNLQDIHPRNKQDVGKRLANWALAKTYGLEGLVYSGPLYREMNVQGQKIRLSFDHVHGGLMAKDGRLSEFTIAGADQNFVEAQAIIEGDSVVVWCDQIAQPVAVRYGWSNLHVPSLFNKDGLPASSFRTDDWQ